jgi:hypothetical protein
MQDVAERIDPLFVYRKRDFLEARSTVVGGMEPGDLHGRSSSTKCVLAGNDEYESNGASGFLPQSC